MVSLDSVDTRRRLLKRLPDWIIVGVLALIGGCFFVLPLFRHETAPIAPLFHGTALDGKPFVLQRERGHMVVLDFFATWCDPCRQSLPLVEQFAAEEPDVRVIAVDQGEPEKVVAPFARAMHLQHVVLDRYSAVGQAYNVSGLPTLVGIDAEGHIRNIWLGYSPQIKDRLRDAKQRYDVLRRARKAAIPLRPS